VKAVYKSAIIIRLIDMDYNILDAFIGTVGLLVTGVAGAYIGAYAAKTNNGAVGVQPHK